MAQKGVQLDKKTFSCSICLDLLKDPVTIPCGHSYCLNCIKTHLDGEGEKRLHSCPQCRQTFTSRPVLLKNTMLAALVEELKKTGLQADPAGPEDVACDVCTGRKLKAHKSCLVCLASFCEEHLQPHHESPAFEKHKLVDPSMNHKVNIQKKIQDREKDVKLLQQEVEAINHSANKAVEDSEKMFTELIRLLEKRSSDVKQQVRSQQETEVSRVKELQEKLQQEITELKRKDTELEQLSHTEDHNQFLHNYPSLSTLSESIELPSTKVCPLQCFEDVTATVSEVRDKLLDVLNEKWPNIPQTVIEVEVLLPQPEPRTRAEFLKYSHEITMDPYTAHSQLFISRRSRKATVIKVPQTYSSHPEGFTGWCQVLSKESLTGRCYWEVEWRARGIHVAVSYKNVGRARNFSPCEFGMSEKSWALLWDNNSYHYWNNNETFPISVQSSYRLGVYLDQTEGILSFYKISDTTMTLLHRVKARFTKALYAGIWISNYPGTSAEFCKLK